MGKLALQTLLRVSSYFTQKLRAKQEHKESRQQETLLQVRPPHRRAPRPRAAEADPALHGGRRGRVR